MYTLNVNGKTTLVTEDYDQVLDAYNILKKVDSSSVIKIKVLEDGKFVDSVK
jgi:hypothetical protein